MKANNVIPLIFMCLLFIGCKSYENKYCVWNDLKIFKRSYLYGRDRIDTSYMDYVCLEKYPRRCVDSVNPQVIVDRYLNLVDDSTTLSKIEFLNVYNSIDYFYQDYSHDRCTMDHTFLFEVTIDRFTKKTISINFDAEKAESR